jgi:choline dehydrogenase-like flavoprotein
MIRRGEDVPANANLHADVCIVGAGAAGITLALELSRNAPHISVLVLEGGTDPVLNDRPPPDRVSRSQFLYEGELEGDLNTIRPQFLTQTRSRSFGGSTNCWGGRCRPLDEVDFQGHGVYEGWPISRSDLVPFYRRAQEICFLDRFEYDDPQYWAKRARASNVWLAPIPDQGKSEMRSVVFQNMREPRVCFFQDYRDELAASGSVTVVTNATLCAIVAGADEQGSAVDTARALRLGVLDVGTWKPAKEFTATARRFVLALGGIETVRALLTSRSENQPRGLGNNAGQLGRYFAVHPVVSDAARVTFGGSGWPKEVRDFYSIETRFPPETPGESVAPRVVPGQRVQSYEEEALAAIGCEPRRPDEAVYTRVWAALVPTVSALARTEAGNFRVILRGDLAGTNVDVNWEQTSEYENQVAPTTEKDVFGIPKVVIRWCLHERDEETYETALKLTEDKLREAGYLHPDGKFNKLFDIRDRNSWRLNLPNPGDHHMGGTRMSADAGAGVVNPDTRVHGMTNLYVASCSVWPSTGWANPTLTIVAIASRLAHHLIDLAGAAGSVPTHDVGIPSSEPARGEVA